MAASGLSPYPPASQHSPKIVTNAMGNSGQQGVPQVHMLLLQLPFLIAPLFSVDKLYWSNTVQYARSCVCLETIICYLFIGRTVGYCGGLCLNRPAILCERNNQHKPLTNPRHKPLVNTSHKKVTFIGLVLLVYIIILLSQQCSVWGYCFLVSQTPTIYYFVSSRLRGSQFFCLISPFTVDRKSIHSTLRDCSSLNK